ncbi:hypothetical protein [Thalassobius sp. I31.1]|uniref:hypothetical protein n=1 Tax=Thalassobius sp. I31.1 TaxID=2109912 RepID=UPI000D1A6BB7|nr:hypothetical protein [Thalassobius sp. I31.1]
MTILLDAQSDPAAFLAAIEAESVDFALCCEMQFLSETLYMSNRNVGFVSGGREWKGLGKLVDLSAPSGGSEDLAPVMEYTLSLPWDLIDEGAKNGIGQLAELMYLSEEYERRIARLSVQIFQDGEPGGDPFVLHVGRMSKPHLSVEWGKPVVFRIDAESILVGQQTPPSGKLTDADQKARHPGDRGLEAVPNAVSEAVDWLNS